MFAYLVRKLVLTVTIVFGVVLLTFVLFNVVAKNPARAFVGKAATPDKIEAMKRKMGLDKPRFAPNREAYRRTGHLSSLLDTQFLNVLAFRFPPSMRYQESVWSLFARKAPISLAVQGPAFVIGLGLQFIVAVAVAARRGSAWDLGATGLAVLSMSIPAVSLYLGVQWLFGAYLLWFPIAGWAPGFLYAIHFAALPILVSTVGSLGGGVRFYRTVALEEINTDYVRTARAKGVGPGDVLLVHVFRNLLIPVVTNTIVAIPLLVTGSVILERMFQIPGFGGLLIDSILAQDTTVVLAEVYLTAIAYAVTLYLTDVCYTLVDPRVTLR